MPSVCRIRDVCGTQRVREREEFAPSTRKKENRVVRPIGIVCICDQPFQATEVFDAMKRRRNTGLFVLLIILAFMAFTVITQSISQNNRVRRFTNSLLRAYQTRDTNSLRDKYYQNQSVSAQYYKLVQSYTLLGWEITHIDGQPYPMNTEGVGTGGSFIYNTVRIDLYYKPVDKFVTPEGRYQRIKHPVYGDSMVVPAVITYSYGSHRDPQWFVKPPEEDDTGTGWLLPFDKPLPRPLG